MLNKACPVICKLTVCTEFALNYNNIIGGSTGGVLGARHPLWDPILLFLHTFSLKSTHVGGPHPPQWVHPPLREILDPPLNMASTRTGMREHFRVREKPGKFDHTGKEREISLKYWKNQ